MEVEYFQGQIAANKSRHALVHFLEKERERLEGGEVGALVREVVEMK